MSSALVVLPLMVVVFAVAVAGVFFFLVFMECNLPTRVACKIDKLMLNPCTPRSSDHHHHHHQKTPKVNIPRGALLL